MSAEGGAIYNQGALTLSGVTLQNNIAYGVNSRPAPAPATCGGGIWSNGSLTLENGTLLEGNQARGAAGGAELYGPYIPAGDACGGALYVAGGTANITDTTFTGNWALGGPTSTRPFRRQCLRRCAVRRRRTSRSHDHHRDQQRCAPHRAQQPGNRLWRRFFHC